ncbi:MAG: AbrB/MazE/SpoVT family DNA-binding domain-containing protein [Eubacteriales bacterium]|nr:AbrB/MazE/SpoVT family DNA-binding domain-containing protein [Eubacteriales bacterium]
MSMLAFGSGIAMERKTIRISEKRQITIPQKFFEALGFGREAECALQDGVITIRPVKERDGGEFAEEILADLISQGFEGQDLIERFKEQNRRIRPAVERLVAEADDLVKAGKGKKSLDELFGTED